MNPHTNNTFMAEPQLSPTVFPQAPKPPKKTSLKSILIVFGVAFVALLFLLNLPTLVKAFAYPFSHSPESDNEQLTQQYRDLYGSEKHPELMAAVESSMPQSSPSMFPIAPLKEFNATISIPKIGVTAPVLQVANTEDATILTALKNGVVMYPGSAMPGQVGSTVIVGHSSSDLPWTKYSAIFSLLDRLQPNDIIYVTANGTQYAYRVRTVQKGSAQQLINSGLAGDLIVSTCWPVGTDKNRIAVSATLVQ